MFTKMLVNRRDLDNNMESTTNFLNKVENILNDFPTP
jgi:hypothetical protein